MQLIPRPDAGATPRAATRPETGRAWLLDPVALHAEFDTLFAGLTDDDGLIPFRGRVSHLWHSHDPVLREFIESQRVHTPEDSRRLAWGRELLSLAETHGDESGAAALGHVMRFGYKGWLSQDDVVDLLARFRAMNPRVFRRAQHLVPLVEDAFEALTTASRAGDRVLVLAPR